MPELEFSVHRGKLALGQIFIGAAAVKVPIGEAVCCKQDGSGSVAPKQAESGRARLMPAAAGKATCARTPTVGTAAFFFFFFLCVICLPVCLPEPSHSLMIFRV